MVKHIIEWILKGKGFEASDKVKVTEFYRDNRGAGWTSRDIAEKFLVNSHNCVLDWLKNINEFWAILFPQRKSNEALIRAAQCFKNSWYNGLYHAGRTKFRFYQE